MLLYYIKYTESTVYDRMRTSYIAMTIPNAKGDDGRHRGIGAKNFVAGVSDKCRGIGTVLGVCQGGWEGYHVSVFGVGKRSNVVDVVFKIRSGT